ncbi:uncharacterized protein LOC129589969 [Paramacrobiotus metropolitanus]|uniref:uncharacterized protein LOC129589969 n=1 Tax=Paramacrobiotus metropolitanus TaxID=2943436 RepID=UPI002445CBE6|nr:uncharacterized protein LOC129589969 [Paramacrobiotus metropolitanus]
MTLLMSAITLLCRGYPYGEQVRHSEYFFQPTTSPVAHSMLHSTHVLTVLAVVVAVTCQDFEYYQGDDIANEQSLHRDKRVYNYNPSFTVSPEEFATRPKRPSLPEEWTTASSTTPQPVIANGRFMITANCECVKCQLG